MAIEFLPPPEDEIPAPRVNGAVHHEAAPAFGLRFRELTTEEIASLRPVFLEAKAEMPDPAVSTFVGAVEDGKVIGFLVLQAKLHAEPMWIEPGRSEIFKPLVAATEEVILRKTGPQWVYLFSPAGRVSQLAQSMGMQLEPWCVMTKLVQPPAPSRPVLDLNNPEPDAMPRKKRTRGYDTSMGVPS